ncbi:DeoR/GlpR family DNA-binding transcription regulator [Saxibacter everestensis]|uniref:Lactose phosphotransferase system repressor n=1 Tax=Saxibacter everestensis TaxID=2909229 RepID=A0ABY8QTI5_9MICO|nr:DeoR/GlpR family DNA-binding transcription regulator [Brevibacteriaceae bacterium ZFBP1038]
MHKERTVTAEGEAMQLGSKARRDAIVRLATETGPANVDDLSRKFAVTASTIRRDLALLTDAGRLARTYGGAISVTAHPEATLRQRLGEAYLAKQAIARWARMQVRSGETLLLDAGSTVGALAHELRSATSIRVATVGLTTLNELADVDEVEVECLGGRLRHISQGFVGPLTEAALERMTFDRVFLGTDGVHPVHGICEAELEQTRLKELMAGRAREVYVLAHADKLGESPFHAWAKLPAGWHLVTDQSAPDSMVARFETAGVEVVRA